MGVFYVECVCIVRVNVWEGGVGGRLYVYVCVHVCACMPLQVCECVGASVPVCVNMSACMFLCLFVCE